MFGVTQRGASKQRATASADEWFQLQARHRVRVQGDVGGVHQMSRVEIFVRLQDAALQ